MAAFHSQAVISTSHRRLALKARRMNLSSDRVSYRSPNDKEHLALRNEPIEVSLSLYLHIRMTMPIALSHSGPWDRGQAGKARSKIDPLLRSAVSYIKFHINDSRRLMKPELGWSIFSWSGKLEGWIWFLRIGPTLGSSFGISGIYWIG